MKNNFDGELIYFFLSEMSRWPWEDDSNQRGIIAAKEVSKICSKMYVLGKPVNLWIGIGRYIVHCVGNSNNSCGLESSFIDLREQGSLFLWIQARNVDQILSNGTVLSKEWMVIIWSSLVTSVVVWMNPSSKFCLIL